MTGDTGDITVAVSNIDSFPLPSALSSVDIRFCIVLVGWIISVEILLSTAMVKYNNQRELIRSFEKQQSRSPSKQKS